MQKPLKDSFSHSRAFRIQMFFLSPNHGGRLFSVPWLLHFEIHFVGPILAFNYRESPVLKSIKLSRIQGKQGMAMIQYLL